MKYWILKEGIRMHCNSIYVVKMFVLPFQMRYQEAVHSITKTDNVDGIK